jgi:hypothetical protein
MRNFSYLALTTLVLTTACPAPKKDTLPEERFCVEYSARECAAVAPQCNAAPKDCEPGRALACMTRVAIWKAALSGPRTYHAENVQTCLDKISETYSKIGIKGTALQELDKVCARVYQGNAKATEPCQVDLDCSANLACDGTKLRCGVPKQVSAGGGCANIGEYCPPTDHCRAVAGTFLCAKRQGKGQPCSAAEPCLESLLCAGTCVDKSAAGAVCTTHDECTDGYCSPFSGRCGAALIFAEGADSCRGFLGQTVPTRAPVSASDAAAVPDAGTDAL